MKRISISLVLLCITSFALYFVVASCDNQEKGIVNVSQDKEKEQITLKKPPLCEDGGYQVYRYLYNVAIDRYTPMAGKYYGAGWTSMANNQVNRTQYGCNLVLTGSTSDISQLNGCGYSKDYIIIALPDVGWQAIVDSAISKGVKRFYIDEPIFHNRGQMVLDAAPYIAARGGDLTISESLVSETNAVLWYNGVQYRTDIGLMITLALLASPSPYVSCHSHYVDHPWPIPNIDPRDHWSYIKERVPHLFKMVIIKSGQDTDNMLDLFGHANNLGIKEILYYPNQIGVTTPNPPYVGISRAVSLSHSRCWASQFYATIKVNYCCEGSSYNPATCVEQSSQVVGGQWVPSCY